MRVLNQNRYEQDEATILADWALYEQHAELPESKSLPRQMRYARFNGWRRAQGLLDVRLPLWLRLMSQRQ